MKFKVILIWCHALISKPLLQTEVSEHLQRYLWRMTQSILLFSMIMWRMKSNLGTACALWILLILLVSRDTLLCRNITVIFTVFPGGVYCHFVTAINYENLWEIKFLVTVSTSFGTSGLNFLSTFCQTFENPAKARH